MLAATRSSWPVHWQSAMRTYIVHARKMTHSVNNASRLMGGWYENSASAGSQQTSRLSVITKANSHFTPSTIATACRNMYSALASWFNSAKV